MKEGAERHPPFLTLTERRRFISSYYEMETLVLLEEPVRRRKIEATTLKRLLMWREMLWVFYTIGGDTFDTLLETSSHKLFEVIGEVDKRVTSITQHFYERDLSNGIAWQVGSPPPFQIVTYFDFFQSVFKELLLEKRGWGRSVGDLASNRSCLWYDTSDDEDD